MKCLVITNNKGGVAKTTTAVHLLWYASQRGVKTVLYDLDEQQANATQWATGHKVRDPVSGEKYKSEWGGEVVYLPTQIETKYELIIVDTRPDATQLSVFNDYVTHILIPFKGRFSRNGIEDVLNTITYLNLKKKVSLCALPVMTDTTIQAVRDIEMAKRIGIPLMKPIRYYPFVERAEEEGRPVWTLPWGIRSTILDRIIDIYTWVMGK